MNQTVRRYCQISRIVGCSPLLVQSLNSSTAKNMVYCYCKEDGCNVAIGGIDKKWSVIEGFNSFEFNGVKVSISYTGQFNNLSQILDPRISYR